MKLVVGLGNPEPRYRHTRHNLGFLVLDALRTSGNLPDWSERKRLHALISRGAIEETPVLLVKPTTFMNDSGTAVAAVRRAHGLDIRDIVVVHDDADIALGTIKIQSHRSSAGHRGVESVIATLGSNAFLRVRCGIRTPERDRSDLDRFAMASFRPDEKPVVETLIQRAVERIHRLLLSADSSA